MTLNVLDAASRYASVALGIAHIARLEAEIIGLYAECLNLMLTVEEELQLVASLDNGRAYLAHKQSLWRNGYPIYAFRNGACAVGHDGNPVAVIVQKINELLAEVQDKYCAFHAKTMKLDLTLIFPLQIRFPKRHLTFVTWHRQVLLIWKT